MEQESIGHMAGWLNGVSERADAIEKRWAEIHEEIRGTCPPPHGFPTYLADSQVKAYSALRNIHEFYEEVKDAYLQAIQLMMLATLNGHEAAVKIAEGVDADGKADGAAVVWVYAANEFRVEFRRHVQRINKIEIRTAYLRARLMSGMSCSLGVLDPDEASNVIQMKF